jgi:hypothetical protein
MQHGHEAWTCSMDMHTPYSSPCFATAGWIWTMELVFQCDAAKEIALFSFAFSAFAFFKLDFLRPPSLFVGFASAKVQAPTSDIYYYFLDF